MSKIRCYNRNKLGHFVNQCTKESKKGKGKRKHHVHTTDDDEHEHEHTSQKKTKTTLDEEYVFISTLIGAITHENDIWLVDSGTSKHMTGYKSSITRLIEKDSSLHVELGDNSKHAVKGVGEASYKLESGEPIKMKNALLMYLV